MGLLAAPTAAAPAEEHANWLELRAFTKEDRIGSIEDLVCQFRRSGSTDALDSLETIREFTDGGSEKSQAIAEDAFSEMDERRRACGISEQGYPFEVHPRYILARSEFDQSVYTFLLVLSRFGKDAGPSSLDAADLFERVSAWAARQYFGGADRGANSYLFGFPRRVTPRGFASALDELCRQMNEGGGCKNHPTRRDQKDAKLDLAVWHAFDDGRVGKLIGFGQCGTGNDWSTKLSELQATAFCKKWMYDLPKVDPVRMFFVPFRVERQRWDHVCIDGGILFDRCRISSLTTNLDGGLREKCGEWTRHVIKEHVAA